jgi:hypothetical protein
MTNPTPRGIPTHCAGCGAPLHAHNLTRLCSECKLIGRNRRLSGRPADTTDPVSYQEAINTITTVLGARVISTGEQLT